MATSKEQMQRAMLREPQEEIPVMCQLANGHTVCSPTVNPDLVGKRIQINTHHFSKLKLIGPAPGCIKQIPQSFIFLLKGCLGLH